MYILAIPSYPYRIQSTYYYCTVVRRNPFLLLLHLMILICIHQPTSHLFPLLPYVFKKILKK